MTLQRLWNVQSRTFLTCIFWLGFASVTTATVVCSRCRPLSLQEGPGIGLSLSPGHGSASVQHVNGTVFDVTMIEGTDEYTRAMQRWPSLKLKGNIEAESSSLKLTQKLLSRLGWTRPVKQKVPEELIPILNMIQDLWMAIKESADLQYEKVWLSVPDYVEDDPLYHQLRQLVGLDGLQCTNSWKISRSASFHLYGVQHCFDEDDNADCERYRGRVINSVLSLHLDKKSLSIQRMDRDDGMMSLGEAKLIWNVVGFKDEVRHFAKSDIDLVVLSGPEAFRLYEVIAELFKNNPKVLAEDYQRSLEDHTFASARGAAKLARDEMCIDADDGICIPRWSWCEISKYCRSSYHLPPDDVKEEL